MNWLYCLFTWSFLPWRLPAFKIGIAADVETRRRQIESELAYACGRPVTVRRAVAVPLMTAGFLEKKLHGVFARLRARMPRHAGHTEWFSICNFWAVVLLIWLSREYDLNLKPWHAVAVFFLPLPIDGALLLIAAAFVEYALFCALLWGLFNLLTIAL